MQIRRARADEAAALSALAFASKSHWPYTPHQMEGWRAGLTISPYTVAWTPVWLAETEGGIAGFFVLVPGQQEWLLDHFWVLPACMGRGVGRALLAAAARIAAQGGAGALLIHSDPHAEGFYRACGAVRTGAQPAPLPGQPERVLPVMRLALPQ